MELLAPFILLTSFILLIQNKIYSMISTFIWQSTFLAIVIFSQALKTPGMEFYISFILFILIKIIFIPYILYFFVKKLNLHCKISNLKYPIVVLFSSVILTLFCYEFVAPLFNIMPNINNILIAMLIILLGILLLITNNNAVSYVIGFLSIENGIFFATLVITKGMPVIVEIGIAFDILIAVTLFGVLFMQIHRSIDSLDVNEMNLLREDIE